MKLDNWTQFNLSREDQQFFTAFASPDNETSIAKDVPIGSLDQVRPILRRVQALAGKKTYIMFRGRKNRYHGQSTTWKQDADRFAVYWR
jgi:hypothetical protein